MAIQAVPTKGNLMTTKKSLELAKVGFDLLDRKRNILIREMMTLIDRAAEIQDKIDITYSRAYQALQKANTTLGICEELFLKTIPWLSPTAVSWGWRFLLFPSPLPIRTMSPLAYMVPIPLWMRHISVLLK